MYLAIPNAEVKIDEVKEKINTYGVSAFPTNSFHSKSFDDGTFPRIVSKMLIWMNKVGVASTKTSPVATLA